MDDDLRRARLFLRAAPALFLPVFALPLLLHPYAWARRFGWRQDQPETDVGLYFGRCLGAVATGICVEAVRASRAPQDHPGMFRLLELVSWLLAAVHVRGLLERRQPPVEHAEIVGYSAVALLARKAAPRHNTGA